MLEAKKTAVDIAEADKMAQLDKAAFAKAEMVRTEAEGAQAENSEAEKVASESAEAEKVEKKYKAEKNASKNAVAEKAEPEMVVAQAEAKVVEEDEYLLTKAVLATIVENEESGAEAEDQNMEADIIDMEENTLSVVTHEHTFSYK